MQLLEIISFLLISLSTIGLLIIPITFDKRLKGWDEGIEKYTSIIKELREFRFKSTESLKQYSQLNLLNEIYKSTTIESKRLDFIEDNIKETLREAHRYIATWDPNSDKSLERTQKLSTQELFNEIFQNQESMAKKLDEFTRIITNANRSKEKVKRIKNRTIVWCVILNTLGLGFGFISAHKTATTSDKIQMEILKKIDSIGQLKK